jgi:DNA-binding CsgD family transcriptional regulator
VGAAGPRRPRPCRRSAAAVQRAHPTEQRIAGLVGEGKKNREVADALFISVKTVEANLSRIFHKLGVARAPSSPAGSPPHRRGFPPIPRRSTRPRLGAQGSTPIVPREGKGIGMEPTAATAELPGEVWRRVVIVAAMVSALVGGVVGVAGLIAFPKRGWVCVDHR